MGAVGAEGLAALASAAFPSLLIDLSLRAVVVVLAAVTVLTLARGLPAAKRHLVLLTAVVVVALLPALSLVLPPLPLPILPANGNLVADEAAPVAPMRPDEATSEVVAHATAADAEASIAYEVVDRGVAHLTKPDRLIGWPSFLATVWGAGVFLAATPVVAAVGRLRWLRRRARIVTDDAWAYALDEAMARVGLRRKVLLIESDRIRMPMTWGVWRPVIALPTGLGDWSHLRRVSVLVHECSHVARLDCLTQHLAHVAWALFWFHPLVWYAVLRLRIEREMACDDVVLRVGAMPVSYAQELYDIATSRGRPGFTAAAAVAMARPSQVERRLQAILDRKRRRVAVARPMVMGSLITAVVLAVPFATVRATSRSLEMPIQIVAPEEVTPVRSAAGIVTIRGLSREMQIPLPAGQDVRLGSLLAWAVETPTGPLAARLTLERHMEDGPQTILKDQPLCDRTGSIWQAPVRPGDVVTVLPPESIEAQPLDEAHAPVRLDAPVSMSVGHVRWLSALPGSVTGTPVPADLDGDGDLEIVVPCLARDRYRTLPLVHPRPTEAAVLAAFHHTGEPVRGFPIVLVDERFRALDREHRATHVDDWASSPSVADFNGDKRDDIVIATNGAGVVRVRLTADGRVLLDHFESASPWASIPLVDLEGDGRLDLVAGGLLARWDGGPVADWQRERRPIAGFAPAVDDVDLDGDLELFYASTLQDEGATDGYIYGLDHTGQRLTYTKRVGRQSLFPPVIGDVIGDERAEIVVTDQKGHIHVWHADGTPAAGTHTCGNSDSVLRCDLESSDASASLADLDGDGKAEIIAYHKDCGGIHAWYGNGRAFGARDDGLIAHVGHATHGGVTVADLGGDGVIDLFVGVAWVQRSGDGHATVLALLEGTTETVTQCSIVDLERDGSAEILFGLTDGRVGVYDTGMAYRPEWVQWATNNGDFRHTGRWRRPIVTVGTR